MNATKTMDHRQRCELLGDFFGIFANAARMRIFCCLNDGPFTVSQIARNVGITLPNASQHLRLMRQMGAVKAIRAGQRVYYHLADERLIQAADLIGRVIEERQPMRHGCKTGNWKAGTETTFRKKALS